MAETKLTVADNLAVSIDFALRLADGELIDATTDNEPLEFLQGQGQIIPGLEQALYGMAVGDEKDVVVAPADGYGTRDADAVEVVAHDVFPPDLTLEPGMALRMRDESGRAFEAYVTDVRPEGVSLDFNHPLADETLHFHVKIVGLRPASNEELEHGHVHSPEHGH
ncbi:MAG: peptidylprolyl isomerase [Anaerolineales bacterium]|nr:MAG: peptidylprolyl isomerase [Anaerolineales bacterium]